MLGNAIVAAAFYTFDVLVIGQLGFVLLATMIAIVIALVRVLKSAAERSARRALLNALAGGIWLVIAAAAIGSISLQARIGRERGDRVVAALEAYRQAEGTYPESLDALVPTYVSSVPRARYTVAFGSFHYFRTSDGRASFGFTTNAPFGRAYYSFERKEWGSLD